VRVADASAFVRVADTVVEKMYSGELFVEVWNRVDTVIDMMIMLIRMNKIISDAYTYMWNDDMESVRTMTEYMYAYGKNIPIVVNESRDSMRVTLTDGRAPRDAIISWRATWILLGILFDKTASTCEQITTVNGHVIFTCNDGIITVNARELSNIKYSYISRSLDFLGRIGGKWTMKRIDYENTVIEYEGECGWITRLLGIESDQSDTCNSVEIVYTAPGRGAVGDAVTLRVRSASGITIEFTSNPALLVLLGRVKHADIISVVLAIDHVMRKTGFSLASWSFSTHVAQYSSPVVVLHYNRGAINARCMIYPLHDDSGRVYAGYVGRVTCTVNSQSNDGVSLLISDDGELNVDWRLEGRSPSGSVGSCTLRVNGRITAQRVARAVERCVESIG